MDAQTFMDKIDEIVANAPNDYPVIGVSTLQEITTPPSA